MDRREFSPIEARFSGYSSAFVELIKQHGERQLLEGSHVHETSFEQWKKEREAIAGHINQEGPLLDFGCANGFLLKCLQEWSDKRLDVYGVDVDETMIEAAQELFPDQADHFAVTPEQAGAFPEQFNTIYWNIWDNLTAEEATPYLEKMLEKLAEGGRIIIGSYHPSVEVSMQRFEEIQEELPDGLTATIEYKKDQNVERYMTIDKPKNEP